MKDQSSHIDSTHTCNPSSLHARITHVAYSNISSRWSGPTMHSQQLVSAAYQDEVEKEGCHLTVPVIFSETWGNEDCNKLTKCLSHKQILKQCYAERGLCCAAVTTGLSICLPCLGDVVPCCAIVLVFSKLNQILQLWRGHQQRGIKYTLTINSI